MATKDSKNNESLNRVKNFLAKARYWFKKIGETVLAILLLLILGVLLFNPITFVLWALCSPQKAAVAVYDCEVPVLQNILRMYCRPMIACLPFYSKKRFMEYRGISEYSVKLQLRYFWNSNDNKPETLKAMCSEAIKVLWEDSNNELKTMIVKSGFKISNEMFKKLLNESLLDAARYYISKFTPSTVMVEIMLGNSVRYGAERRNLFLFSVSKHGLPTNIMTGIFGNFLSYVEQIQRDLGCYRMNETREEADFKKNHPYVQEIEYALKVYSQNQMRTASYHEYQNVIWENLVASEEVTSEVQSLMSVWQYEMFRKAGQSLDAKAIVKILKNGDRTMAERIFEYELQAVESNQQAVAIVRTNSELQKRFFAAKAKAKAKN